MQWASLACLRGAGEAFHGVLSTLRVIRRYRIVVIVNDLATKFIAPPNCFFFRRKREIRRIRLLDVCLTVFSDYVDLRCPTRLGCRFKRRRLDAKAVVPSRLSHNIPAGNRRLLEGEHRSTTPFILRAERYVSRSEVISWTASIQRPEPHPRKEPFPSRAASFFWRQYFLDAHIVDEVRSANIS